MEISKIINSGKKENMDLIDRRMKEFSNLGRKSEEDIFKELCFCIMTANFKADRGIEIQKQIGNGFLNLTENKLEKRLRELGYRYPNRASYIIEARKHIGEFGNILKMPEKKAREFLVKNIKGLGMKESSHFLRNIGKKNLAILDFHILDLMERQCLLHKPKTLTPKLYLKIENILENIAKKYNTNLAELDLLLWGHETGKVLK